MKQLVRPVAQAIASWVAEHDGDEQNIEDWIGAAEAVIDALGIEQVGWWNDIAGAHGGAAPHHGCGADADVPVFTLGAITDPSLTAET